MPVEAWRVVVEQSRHVGARQIARRVAFAQQREPCRRALRVGWIGGETGAESGDGALALGELLFCLAERKQRRRPCGRALQRLFQHLGGGGPVTVFRRRARVSVAAIGDRVAADERVGPARAQRFLCRSVSK